MVYATSENTIQLARPLDVYRVFYEQTSHIEAAELFPKERLSRNECVIFIALVDGLAVGFTQLHISFSSVSLK